MSLRSALCGGGLAPSGERGVCPPRGAGKSLSPAARSLSTLEPLPKRGISGLSALSLGNLEPEYMGCGFTGHRS